MLKCFKLHKTERENSSTLRKLILCSEVKNLGGEIIENVEIIDKYPCNDNVCGAKTKSKNCIGTTVGQPWEKI